MRELAVLAVNITERALLEQARLGAARADLGPVLAALRPSLVHFAERYAEGLSADVIATAQAALGWTRPQVDSRAALLRLVAAAVTALVRQARRLNAQDGAACPSDAPACRLGLLGGTCALPAGLVLPGAGAPTERPARFCLVEAEKLRTSHDPLRGFAPTPGYPAEVQERPYERDKGEQLKVLRIAAQLDPRLVFTDAPGAIDGPPVVTTTGLVLGGNGRAMGLRLAYASGDTRARDFLIENAPRFGFEPQVVQALSAPVLVRVVGVSEADPKGLREYVRLLNVPLSQSLDVRAEAVAEARRLTDEVLALFAQAFEGAASLAEYLRSPAVQDLITALRRAGIVTERNASRLLAGGRFSEEGALFVERLLAAALLPSAELLGVLNAPERQAIARAAPFFLSAGAVAGPAWDVRPALRAALEDLLDAQSRGQSDLQSYLRQGALLPDGARRIEAHKPLGPLLLGILWKHHAAPLRLARIARLFADQARRSPLGQPALLPGELLGPAQALVAAQQQVEAET